MFKIGLVAAALTLAITVPAQAQWHHGWGGGGGGWGGPGWGHPGWHGGGWHGGGGFGFVPVPVPTPYEEEYVAPVRTCYRWHHRLVCRED